MKIHRPLWAEGTFLSSQQFQQQARWEAFSNDCIAQLCIRHPWGIANVLFDRDALTPGKLKTQAVRLRFADGTLIDSDVSDVLPLACDLRALKNDSAIVLLALPLAHGNGGNLGQGEQTERPLRYRQEWQKVQDIYGSDSEDMAVERHALSLRFAHDNNQDYITCPLARLVRDVQGNWTQDESYIPPLLAFNAHDGLVAPFGVLPETAVLNVPLSTRQHPLLHSPFFWLVTLTLLLAGVWWGLHHWLNVLVDELLPQSLR
ncbi:type VI secretion system baseplate subunit TssK [Escherichia coli]|uniref:type VI secretion system baseplate subunit TssK n=1 Tax=Escherichia coli TaxID=562 RepID=UPI002889CBE5|nr:type VI secretion system baseplate subunit TssK [Escherichia coli]